jgi:AcrR family transcriptional regulator
MKSPQSPVVSARKAPKQERSARLVSDVLEAAVRVLIKEGARRFTAARVAEAAGVSVGSLYQYFPNKEAILFRLQTDEWDRTRAMLEAILGDASRHPMDRVRSMVEAFFRTEYDEAALRKALDDAAPLYRTSPEALERKAATMTFALSFIQEALPGVSEADQALAARMLLTTMSTLGESVSERAQSIDEVDAWGREVAEMLCAYLERIAQRNRQ